MKRSFSALVVAVIALILSPFAGLDAQASADAVSAHGGADAAQGPYFLSYPCLSPDGQTVVFSYEGDLWKAGTNGGQAVRLTAMPGYETNARFSPDGKWIAFTGRQNGNADVYVMPVDGGEIRQLTYHS